MKIVPKYIWIGRDNDGAYYAYTDKPEWQDCGEYGFGDGGENKLASLCAEELEEWLYPVKMDHGDLIKLELSFVL